MHSPTPPYLVAEISGNHNGDLSEAKELVHACAESGANAAKLQTYTADTLTLNSKKHYFQKKGGLWDGQFLHDLYSKGTTPWEWHAELHQLATSLNIDLFSTPFDDSAVDFLETTINPIMHKVASYELTHLPLLKKIAATKKPVVFSTGMGTLEEITQAFNTLKENGCPHITILKCISGYPTIPTDFNLSSMTFLAEKFQTPVGLSDHSLGHEVALGATALGASFIEKHITLSRKKDRIDSGFSLEPHEFKDMAHQVRTLHAALGKPTFGPTEQELIEVTQRRSIFISNDIKEGEILTEKNIKIVRPGHGLEPKHWESTLGQRATKNLEAGDPLQTTDFK